MVVFLAFVDADHRPHEMVMRRAFEFRGDCSSEDRQVRRAMDYEISHAAFADLLCLAHSVESLLYITRIAQGIDEKSFDGTSRFSLARNGKRFDVEHDTPSFVFLF